MTSMQLDYELQSVLDENSSRFSCLIKLLTIPKKPPNLFHKLIFFVLAAKIQTA